MTDKKLEEYYKSFDYHTLKPVYIDVKDLRPDQAHRLMNSEVFCMMPWTHIHAFPDGRAYPCCLGTMDNPIGNLKQNTLQEVWNDEPMRKMRRNMLTGTKCVECTKCYEQEDMGFLSMRNSQNKHLGHHIATVDETKEDGTFDRFELKYYDIRFSNLCNLSCRTCGDIFSTNWVKEGKRMGWLPKERANVDYAGRFEMDMWEQLLPHLDSVENIYFAGGEPLMMKEHFNILQELIKRGRKEVRLTYNTNFTETIFKKHDILEMWNYFDSVGIGASLDASYSRGEYMRKGTDWKKVVENRRRMLQVCPKVDFYISSTLSMSNAFNIVDLHREWADLELIKPQDFNVNILQDPIHHRLDVLPDRIKQQVKQKYQQHIEWLEPQDHLKRATTGFQAAINFMEQDNKSNLIPTFLEKTAFLDKWREEDFFTTFPELEDLKNYA
jgi:radical SAM protein with 4Fe4S-binding SPASM domain